MLSFIANLLRTILFATLLNDYVKRTYPKKYEDFLVTASFNAVYAFSVIQIKIKQAQKYILNANPRLSKLLETYNKTRVKNTIDFILDGKVIFSTTILTPDIDHPKNSDFIIYSDCKSRNKKILTEVSVDEKYDYEMSDIQFMLVELKIGDNTYKIDLKSDNYNFYVVGNCFTKNFFVYYLTEILKPTQQFDNDNKFIIKIIDHNVDTIEFEFTDKNESILLEKSGYKLLNISNNNVENE
jgi:hypothetical protein